MDLVQGVEGEDQRTVPGFMFSGAMTLMVASMERPPTRAVTRMLPVRLLVSTGTPPSLFLKAAPAVGSFGGGVRRRGSSAGGRRRAGLRGWSLSARVLRPGQPGRAANNQSGCQQ